MIGTFHFNYDSQDFNTSIANTVAGIKCQANSHQRHWGDGCAEGEVVRAGVSVEKARAVLAERGKLGLGELVIE